ncbi:MAG: hypothetical protein IPI58_00385 [Alphaproteobacteria bacterium]|nr:MAG: hypothetical protein IPI58_00385 [Alphaproteobacteria bacterium]
MKAGIRIWAVCGIVGLAATLMGVAALAGEGSVRVRGGVHADYDRLVFDWPQDVPYTLSRKDNLVTLTFRQSARAIMESVPANKFAHLRGLAQESKSGALSVTFSVTPGGTVRHFRDGTRVVVDVRGGGASGEIARKDKDEDDESTDSAKANTTLLAQESHSASAQTAPPVKPVPPAAKDSPSATPFATAARAEPAAALAATEASAEPQQIGRVLLLRVSPSVPTALAVFVRAGQGYAIFDRKLDPGVVAPTTVEGIKPMALADVSAYRWPVPRATRLKVERQGTSWLVWQVTSPEAVPGLSIFPQMRFGLGDRLLINAINPSGAINMTDPVLGDRLIIVPLPEANQKILDARAFAELRLLPTEQGVVVRPLEDTLVAAPVADGLEITSHGGLRLSQPSDTGRMTGAMNAPAPDLFDLMGWRGDQRLSLTEGRQKMLADIIERPETDKPRLHLDLARLYFSWGLAQETIGTLQMLAKESAVMTKQKEYRSLKAAALIMTGYPDEGLAEFSALDMMPSREAALWRGLAQAGRHEWDAALKNLIAGHAFLRGYPEPFFGRFMVLASETAIAAGDMAQAATWLDELDAQPVEQTSRDTGVYLRGVVEAKRGHGDAAQRLWESVTDSRNRLVGVRAELSLVDLAIARGKMTPLQATERLEGLRYVWRGDDLEIDILRRLGEFHVQARQYSKALSAFGFAGKLYPQSPMVPELQKQMTTAFRQAMLNAPQETGLTPLEALSLYQNYGAQLVSGDDRDAIGRRLAEQLVSVDLLDRAAGLLEEQALRMKTPEGSAIGARAAAIRLLDGKAKEAVAILDSSNYPGLTDAQQHERRMLRARALSDMDQADAALALLDQDDSETARMLRSDITWQAKHWAQAAEALARITNDKAGKALNEKEAQLIARQAVALALAGDDAKLQALRQSYLPAMEKTHQASIFNLLTGPQRMGSLLDVAVARTRVAEVGLFQSVLDSYRKVAPSGAEAPAPSGPVAPNP